MTMVINMMLIIGLFLIIPSVLLLIKIKDYRSSSKLKIKLNILTLLMSILFIIIVFMVNMDPFKFEIQTKEDYLIYSALIFLFSPFLWINAYIHLSQVFRGLRFKKNAKVKDKNTFKYYRDDLNKVSPSTLMFVRNFELDIKKAVSSTILKLKLTKNINESKGNFSISNNENTTCSEKLILDLISRNKFDEKEYENEVAQETINFGFIKKHPKNILIKILRILLVITIPVIVTISSVKLDNYVFTKYKFYVKDGNRYLLVEDDIGDIHFDKPANFDDYYNGYIKEEGRYFYDKSLINTKKLNYPEVRKAMIYHTADLLLTLLAFSIIFISIYKLIEELKYINKNYKRTVSGNDLLTKSYALKNFLTDFSYIKSRKEEELILWEYYLVYATVLGINVDINDKLIQKYIN